MVGMADYHRADNARMAGRTVLDYYDVHAREGRPVKRLRWPFWLEHLLVGLGFVFAITAFLLVAAMT